MNPARFRIAMLSVPARALVQAGASAAAEPPMHDAATPGTPETRMPHGQYVGAVLDGEIRIQVG